MSADSRAYRFEAVRFYAAIGLIRYWKHALVLAAVCTAFLYGRCGGDPPASDPGVVDTVMVEKPVAEPTIRERIVYRNIPVERRVVVEKVDTLLVREFVEAAQNPDSLPPVHAKYSGEFDGETLSLWAYRSDGARTFSEHDVRPTFRFGWDADSTWAREERLARFPTMKVAAGTAIVAGVVVCLLVCR